jgi:hypothetical protein
MLRTKTTEWILWATLCFLVYLPFPAFATTIVAILEERSITISADGIATGTSKKTGNLVRNSVCKIRCVDRLCFAAAGRYNSDTIKYNVFQLAEKELHRAGTPEEVSERFKTVIAPLVPKIVATAKKETPQWYAKWLKGDPLIAYLFAGFDRNGKSLIVTGEAKIDVKGRALPVRVTTGRGESGVTAALSFGQNEQIMDFMKRNPMWPDSAALRPSEFAESMIRIEIQASEKEGRRDVGEPISIVRLTDKSHYSVERIGNCRSRQVRVNPDKTVEDAAKSGH